KEMGCMKVIPKSHLGLSKAHEETFHDKNLLARGQAIRGVDENDAVYMPLKQGQFSCHHELLLHASDPNKTDSQRVGLGLFFIPTHVKSNIGRRSASLVRGVDDFGHWDKDPTPKSRIDTDMITHIENAGRRYVDQKYRQETETK
ncbi:MAG: phytanoyl-CoA dioxygenase family protein, partial [Rhodospirillaceae bacterium]